MQEPKFTPGPTLTRYAGVDYTAEYLDGPDGADLRVRIAVDRHGDIQLETIYGKTSIQGGDWPLIVAEVERASRLRNEVKD